MILTNLTILLYVYQSNFSHSFFMSPYIQYWLSWISQILQSILQPYFFNKPKLVEKLLYAYSKFIFCVIRYNFKIWGMLHNNLYFAYLKRSSWCLKVVWVIVFEPSIGMQPQQAFVIEYYAFLSEIALLYQKWLLFHFFKILTLLFVWWGMTIWDKEIVIFEVARSRIWLFLNSVWKKALIVTNEGTY